MFCKINWFKYSALILALQVGLLFAPPTGEEAGGVAILGRAGDSLPADGILPQIQTPAAAAPRGRPAPTRQVPGAGSLSAGEGAAAASSSTVSYSALEAGGAWRSSASASGLQAGGAFSVAAHGSRQGGHATRAAQARLAPSAVLWAIGEEAADATSFFPVAGLGWSEGALPHHEAASAASSAAVVTTDFSILPALQPGLAFAAQLGSVEIYPEQLTVKLEEVAEENTTDKNRVVTSRTARTFEQTEGGDWLRLLIFEQALGNIKEKFPDSDAAKSMLLNWFDQKNTAAKKVYEEKCKALDAENIGAITAAFSGNPELADLRLLELNSILVLCQKILLVVEEVERMAARRLEQDAADFSAQHKQNETGRVAVTDLDQLLGQVNKILYGPSEKISGDGGLDDILVKPTSTRQNYWFYPEIFRPVEVSDAFSWPQFEKTYREFFAQIANSLQMLKSSLQAEQSSKTITIAEAQNLQLRATTIKGATVSLVSYFQTVFQGPQDQLPQHLVAQTDLAETWQFLLGLFAVNRSPEQMATVEGASESTWFWDTYFSFAAQIQRQAGEVRQEFTVDESYQKMLNARKAHLIRKLQPVSTRAAGSSRSSARGSRGRSASRGSSSGVSVENQDFTTVHENEPLFKIQVGDTQYDMWFTNCGHTPWQLATFLAYMHDVANDNYRVLFEDARTFAQVTKYLAKMSFAAPERTRINVFYDPSVFRSNWIKLLNSILKSSGFDSNSQTQSSAMQKPWNTYKLGRVFGEVLREQNSKIENILTLGKQMKVVLPAGILSWSGKLADPLAVDIKKMQFKFFGGLQGAKASSAEKNNLKLRIKRALQDLWLAYLVTHKDISKSSTLGVAQPASTRPGDSAGGGAGDRGGRRGNRGTLGVAGSEGDGSRAGSSQGVSLGRGEALSVAAGPRSTRVSGRGDRDSHFDSVVAVVGGGGHQRDGAGFGLGSDSRPGVGFAVDAPSVPGLPGRGAVEGVGAVVGGSGEGTSSGSADGSGGDGVATGVGLGGDGNAAVAVETDTSSAQGPAQPQSLSSSSPASPRGSHRGGDDPALGVAGSDGGGSSGERSEPSRGRGDDARRDSGDGGTVGRAPGSESGSDRGRGVRFADSTQGSARSGDGSRRGDDAGGRGGGDGRSLSARGSVAGPGPYSPRRGSESSPGDRDGEGGVKFIADSSPAAGRDGSVASQGRRRRRGAASDDDGGEAGDPLPGLELSRNELLRAAGVSEEKIPAILNAARAGRRKRFSEGESELSSEGPLAGLLLDLRAAVSEEEFASDKTAAIDKLEGLALLKNGFAEDEAAAVVAVLVKVRDHRRLPTASRESGADLPWLDFGPNGSLGVGKLHASLQRVATEENLAKDKEVQAALALLDPRAENEFKATVGKTLSPLVKSKALNADEKTAILTAAVKYRRRRISAQDEAEEPFELTGLLQNLYVLNLSGEAGEESLEEKKLREEELAAILQAQAALWSSSKASDPVKAKILAAAPALAGHLKDNVVLQIAAAEVQAEVQAEGVAEGETVEKIRARLLQKVQKLRSLHEKSSVKNLKTLLVKVQEFDTAAADFWEGIQLKEIAGIKAEGQTAQKMQVARLVLLASKNAIKPKDRLTAALEGLRAAMALAQAKGAAAGDEDGAQGGLASGSRSGRGSSAGADEGDARGVAEGGAAGLGSAPRSHFRSGDDGFADGASTAGAGHRVSQAAVGPRLYDTTALKALLAQVQSLEEQKKTSADIKIQALVRGTQGRKKTAGKKQQQVPPASAAARGNSPDSSTGRASGHSGSLKTVGTGETVKTAPGPAPGSTPAQGVGGVAQPAQASPAASDRSLHTAGTTPGPAHAGDGHEALAGEVGVVFAPLTASALAEHDAELGGGDPTVLSGSQPLGALVGEDGRAQSAQANPAVQGEFAGEGPVGGDNGGVDYDAGSEIGSGVSASSSASQSGMAASDRADGDPVGGGEDAVALSGQAGPAREDRLTDVTEDRRMGARRTMASATGDPAKAPVNPRGESASMPTRGSAASAVSSGMGDARVPGRPRRSKTPEQMTPDQATEMLDALQAAATPSDEGAETQEITAESWAELMGNFTKLALRIDVLPAAEGVEGAEVVTLPEQGQAIDDRALAMIAAFKRIVGQNQKKLAALDKIEQKFKTRQAAAAEPEGAATPQS